eukprot:scaffold129443_cov33-Tisochrysis_lutea.AAC.1
MTQRKAELTISSMSTSHPDDSGSRQRAIASSMDGLRLICRTARGAMLIYTARRNACSSGKQRVACLRNHLFKELHDWVGVHDDRPGPWGNCGDSDEAGVRHKRLRTRSEAQQWHELVEEHRSSRSAGRRGPLD